MEAIDIQKIDISSIGNVDYSLKINNATGNVHGVVFLDSSSQLDSLQSCIQSQDIYVEISARYECHYIQGQEISSRNSTLTKDELWTNVKNQLSTQEKLEEYSQYVDSFFQPYTDYHKNDAYDYEYGIVSAIHVKDYSEDNANTIAKDGGTYGKYTYNVKLYLYRKRLRKGNVYYVDTSRSSQSAITDASAYVDSKNYRIACVHDFDTTQSQNFIKPDIATLHSSSMSYEDDKDVSNCTIKEQFYTRIDTSLADYESNRTYTGRVYDEYVVHAKSSLQHSIYCVNAISSSFSDSSYFSLPYATSKKQFFIGKSIIPVENSNGSKYFLLKDIDDRGAIVVYDNTTGYVTSSDISFEKDLGIEQFRNFQQYASIGSTSCDFVFADESEQKMKDYGFAAIFASSSQNIYVIDYNLYCIQPLSNGNLLIVDDDGSGSIISSIELDTSTIAEFKDAVKNYGVLNYSQHSPLSAFGCLDVDSAIVSSYHSVGVDYLNGSGNNHSELLNDIENSFSECLESNENTRKYRFDAIIPSNSDSYIDSNNCIQASHLYGQNLYLCASIKKFTVEFKIDSNKATYEGDTTQTIEYGCDATPPAISIKSGLESICEFVGWDTSFNNITKNLTISAVFSKKTYTLHVQISDYIQYANFDTSDTDSLHEYDVDVEAGTYLSSLSSDGNDYYFSKIILDENGFEFNGWKYSNYNSVITCDITATAIINIKTFNIGFEIDSKYGYFLDSSKDFYTNLCAKYSHYKGRLLSIHLSNIEYHSYLSSPDISVTNSDYSLSAWDTYGFYDVSCNLTAHPTFAVGYTYRFCIDKKYGYIEYEEEKYDGLKTILEYDESTSRLSSLAITGLSSGSTLKKPSICIDRKYVFLHWSNNDFYTGILSSCTTSAIVENYECRLSSLLTNIGPYEITSFIPTNDSLSNSVYYIDNRLSSIEFNCLSAEQNYWYDIVALEKIIKLFSIC